VVPVILLHGFVGSPKNWRRVIQAWPGAPEPVALPLPGHHRDHPAAPDWDTNVERVAAMVPAGAVAVGYSMGARLALALLAADRISAAVLVSGHTGLSAPGERAARATSDAAWAALLREKGMPAFLQRWEAQPMFATQRRVERLRSYRRLDRLGHDPEELARSLETMGLVVMPDLRPALVARAARAHLVVGADDEAYLARARALVAEAPALGLDVLPECGHDPTLEQPTALANAAAAAIARWT